jgi:cytoskeletal protein CcmA (bactofilin family)
MDDAVIQQAKTSISSTTTIVGDIKAEEHLIINGSVKGNIEIKNHNFFLGPSGRLEGKIQAQDVKIRGNMNGEIKASGRVEITKEAKFSGKIESKSISVESGAHLDADVNLGRKSPEAGTMGKNTLKKSVA